MSSNKVIPPYKGELEFLYRDEDISVINKPSMFLSVPGRHPENFDSVQSRIQNDYPDAMCAHRLDLDTSGVMVVTHNKDSLRSLHKQFQEREVEKEYVAVVYGLMEQDNGEVSLPLRSDWPNRPLQMVCYENGKNALTRYEIISRNEREKISRVLLRPFTGRSHQLRVHMKELKHPILGCDLYAHPEALKMSSRLLLHATKLEFRHPRSQGKMIFESEAPF